MEVVNKKNEFTYVQSNHQDEIHTQPKFRRDGDQVSDDPCLRRAPLLFVLLFESVCSFGVDTVRTIIR